MITLGVGVILIKNPNLKRSKPDANKPWILVENNILIKLKQALRCN
jgi:hypothetical protein